MKNLEIIENNNEVYIYVYKLKNRIKQLNLKNNKLTLTYQSENKREYILTQEQLNVLKNKKTIKINELSEDNIILDLYFVNLFFDF